MERRRRSVITTERPTPTTAATTAKTAIRGISPASTRRLAGLPSNKDTQTAKILDLVVEVVEAAVATAAEDEREDAAEALAVAEALRGNGRRTPVTVLVQVVA